MVTLNGTKSSDLNNQPLAYTWSLISAPPKSAATIFSLRSPIASFMADVPGAYIVGFVVNDGTLKQRDVHSYDFHGQHASDCGRHSYACS